MSSVAQQLKPDSDKPLVGYKYCRSCWRKDMHASAIEMPKWAMTAASLLTLGLFVRVSPSRCTCCGTLRVF